MKEYEPGKPLISLHIPKCAGLSLTGVLRGWFGEKLRSHYRVEQSNRPPRIHRLRMRMLPMMYKRGLCIHGHFGNTRGDGVRDCYPTAEQFITVLRDPFDLHLSTYFYVKREAKIGGIGAYHDGKAHPIIANNWRLADFLRELKQSYLRDFLPADMNESNYTEIFERQFVHIGITERMQETVDLLAMRLGFATGKVPETNVSNWDEQIPPGAREEFEANNALECEMYRYAMERFDAEAAANL